MKKRLAGKEGGMERGMEGKAKSETERVTKE